MRESASSTRGRYLAGKGIVVPPEEILIDSYISSIDYRYPKPDIPVGVYLYTGHKQISAKGQEEILQIGLQARELPYEELPPMNLAFVIDKSSSMRDDDKIEWVKKGFALYLQKVRDVDFVSLVVFDDDAKVLFPSTRMKDPEVKMRFREAVDGLTPGGGSNLIAGLNLGYEQVMSNYREGYTNRVIFLSDGTEFSSRLRRAGAKTGDLRISLIWDNTNDLDLHVVTPSGEDICYRNRKSHDGGELDVDMNVEGESTKPVENVYWPREKVPEGRYSVYVQNFAYHKNPKGSSTHYLVEVFNNGEISQYEGEVEGTGKASNQTVCTIDYRISRAGKKQGVYAIAEQYKEMGIGISTIGVGVDFDVDLMVGIAEAGGGSSRFIADGKEMERIFLTDFDRMVVTGVRDCLMRLEFVPEVQILGTWGYDYRIEGKTISYSLKTLHHRDYETILVHLRTPALATRGRMTLARFTISYSEVSGKRAVVGPLDIEVEAVDQESPVTGFSDAMILRSGTVLRFAQAMKTIGSLYYADASGAPDPEKIKQALELSVNMRKELKNARLRLGNQGFDDEIGILDRYLQILAEDAQLGDEEKARIARDEEIAPPVADRSLPEQMKNLFREIALEMEAKKGGTIALSGFTMKGDRQPPIVGLLNETGLVELVKVRQLKVVERDRLDAILKEQELALSDLMDTDKAVTIGRILAAQYVLTGTLIEMPASGLILSRVVNVETAQIESAAQVIVPKSKELSSLL